KYRRLVSPGFRPRRVAELESAVRAFVVERLPALEGAPTVDFVAELARRVPSFVVAHYLGVPDQDRDRFEWWTEATVQAGGDEHPPDVRAALAEQYAYFTDLIERRRAEPGDDMLSDLAHSTVDGAPLSTEEILGFAFVMIA